NYDGTNDDILPQMFPLRSGIRGNTQAAQRTSARSNLTPLLLWHLPTSRFREVSHQKTASLPTAVPPVRRDIWLSVRRKDLLLAEVLYLFQSVQANACR